MQLIAVREPGVASLSRRAAAATVDVAIFLPGMIAVAIAAYVLQKRLGRNSGWVNGTGLDSKSAKRLNAVMRLAAGLGVAGRNWRSPGMRIVGIRRVDARTRGPVSVESAVVAAAFDTVTGQVGRAINQPALARYEARRAAAAEELRRIRASHEQADSEEIAQASMDVYRRHEVGCGPLAWRIPAHLAAIKLPALWSRRRQTLTERLAGTVIINER